jgi:hypothetical protein
MGTPQEEKQIMTIEERLIRRKQDQERSELAHKRAKLADDRHHFSTHLAKFVEALRGEAIVPDLGIDLDHWQRVAENPPEELPDRIAVVGEWDLKSYKIRTTLRWGTDLKPNGDNFYILLEWLDHTDASHHATLRIHFFEYDILEAINHLLWEMRKAKEKMDRVAALRVQRLEAAKHFIQAAKDYALELTEYQAHRDEWARLEQERLWKPWRVYEIKVLPGPGVTLPATPEELVVLDEPDDIATRLAASISGTTVVQSVCENGRIEKHTICSFYSAKHVEITEAGWLYHRQYRSDPRDRYDEASLVYVPASVKEKPVDPPKWVGSWQEVCDGILAANEDDPQLGAGYREVYQTAYNRNVFTIAELTDPAQLIK